MPSTRKIIEIDEERCNGCGQCVLDCAEGAIAVVDGKARIISDSYCDGLGACLKGCPQDALHIVERPAAPFDEEAVRRRLGEKPQTPTPKIFPAPQACGCPGAMARSLPRDGRSAGHWPIKLRLVPVGAPFLRNAHLLLTADCAPAVLPDFPALAKGKVVLTMCPKFEDAEALTRKLADVCAQQEPSGCTAVRMEVPCCRALDHVAAEALRHSGADCPLTSLCVGCDGRPADGGF